MSPAFRIVAQRSSSTRQTEFPEALSSQLSRSTIVCCAIMFAQSTRRRTQQVHTNLMDDVELPRTCLNFFGTPQLPQVHVCLSQHPYRKIELEVRVRNGTCLVEDSLDCFLCPSSGLQRPSVLQTVEKAKHTGSCRAMTSSTARSMGCG